ncbi:VOC family protein [Novosphingobium sp.]|uniref:VOC family protein n=1 Tax=Novosphingobium sp. TaxID=1874826 RepID=UPI002FE2BC5A
MNFPQDRWGRPPETLLANLHYLEIACADPARTAAFYEEVMDYSLSRQGDAIVARAPDRNLIFVAGKPKSLVCAGYALPGADELTRLRSRIREAGWPYHDGPTLMFDEAVEVSDPDGNRFVFGLAHDGPPSVSSHALSARLQHVVLASRTPDKIIAFFTDVLGFTLSDVVLDDQGEVRTSFLRCSEEHHSFAVFLAPEDRLDHHCYETTDWNAIRDWADHMAARHIKVQWGPGRHGPGNNLFIFVHDPDGNWVEISAELEVVKHDRPVGQWPHEQRTLNSWGQGLLRS